MKRILFLLAIAITLGVSVQACREMGIDPWDKDKGNGDGNPADTTTLPISSLVGTQWKLVSIVRSTQNNTQNETQIITDDKVITLDFTSTSNVEGRNLCNTYAASFKSDRTGEINFVNYGGSKALCNDNLHDEYSKGLQSSSTYTATEKELRIYYKPEVSIPETGNCTLVFAPFIDEGGSGGGIDLRVQQMVGQSYTLYSFENAGVEEILTDSKDCRIEFVPKVNTTKGYANILADCNKGKADLSFSADYEAMKLDNFSLTEMACQNKVTADRFVDFLRNTAHFEYSEYGTKLTIWSSLTTFAESKMVLKVSPIIDENAIQIQDTPPAGVPFSAYPSFMLLDRKFDGKYIHLYYQYFGQSDDYQISAYSLFEFNLSMPPTVAIDLVTDGTPVASSSNTITQGTALISVDAIRKRITTGNPGTVKMNIVLRWNGMDMGQMEVQL